MRCAVCDLVTGQVTNIVIADPAADAPPAGAALVRIGVSPVDIGWSYAAGVFTQTLNSTDIAAAVAAEDAQGLAPSSDGA